MFSFVILLLMMYQQYIYSNFTVCLIINRSDYKQCRINLSSSESKNCYDSIRQHQFYFISVFISLLKFKFLFVKNTIFHSQRPVCCWKLEFLMMVIKSFIYIYNLYKGTVLSFAFVGYVLVFCQFFFSILVLSIMHKYLERNIKVEQRLAFLDCKKGMKLLVLKIDTLLQLYFSLINIDYK